MPQVSIIILSYNHPEVIDVCLRTLMQTEGSYEVVVVDNGSDDATIAALAEHLEAGRINTLVLEPVNHMFSEGNNIGVRRSDPDSEFILLLNSDVGFLRPDWLSKLIGWAEGTTVATPTIWASHPTIASPGPRDIVSCGWSHDSNVDGHARPEGWCCLIRREWWREMSPDFPFLYGFEEAIMQSVREGAKMGVLWNYAKYMIHREGGSGKSQPIQNTREPDLEAWFKGLEVETLDFTLDCWSGACGGPLEHQSYMNW